LVPRWGSQGFYEEQVILMNDFALQQEMLLPSSQCLQDSTCTTANRFSRRLLSVLKCGI
jgi:hypothetical protein